MECPNLVYLWRVSVALGAIPGLITVYLRTFLPETPRFLVHVVQPRLMAPEDNASACFARPVGQRPPAEQLDTLVREMLPQSSRVMAHAGSE
jgi:hypothetical protein